MRGLACNELNNNKWETRLSPWHKDTLVIVPGVHNSQLWACSTESYRQEFQALDKRDKTVQIRTLLTYKARTDDVMEQLKSKRQPCLGGYSRTSCHCLKHASKRSSLLCHPPRLPFILLKRCSLYHPLSSDRLASEYSLQPLYSPSSSRSSVSRVHRYHPQSASTLPPTLYRFHFHGHGPCLLLNSNLTAAQNAFHRSLQSSFEDQSRSTPPARSMLPSRPLKPVLQR